VKRWHLQKLLKCQLQKLLNYQQPVELVEQRDNMFLFELEDPEVVKFAAIVSQLKSDLDNGNMDPNWNTDKLIDYFQQNGINLDITDLYDMIKKPPLNMLISNIQGDDIVFKGEEAAAAQNPDQTQSQEVVDQMAQSAMK
jgi:uncharacterized membrane protein YvbJ